MNLDFLTTYLTWNVCCYITNIINHSTFSHIEFFKVTQDFLRIQKYVYSKQKSWTNSESNMYSPMLHGYPYDVPSEKNPRTCTPYISGTWGLVGHSQNVPNRFWGLPSIFCRHFNLQVDFRDVLGIFLRCSRHVSSVLTMEIDDWIIWSFIPSTFFRNILNLNLNL